MTLTTSSLALIALTGILATVLVYQEIPSKHASNEATISPDNNNDRQLLMKTATLSHRLLKKRNHLKPIDFKLDDNGFPLDPDHAYRSLHSLLDRYKRQHSQEQLIREFKECQKRNKGTKGSCPELDSRKFLVSYYSCPDSAGNRFHNFMNGMIWAIVTGRTLLYDGFDRVSCHKMLTEVGLTSKRVQNYCDQYGTAEESREQCDRLIERAEWIPSFREWKEELGLKEPTHAYCEVQQGGHADIGHHVQVDELSDRVISACAGVHQDAGRSLFKALDGKYSHVSKESSVEVAKSLMRYDGIYFSEDGGKYQAWQLYGTLFNDAFKIRPHLLPNMSELVLGANVASIAIHSRHINSKDRGNGTAEEEACLRRVLNTIKSQKTVETCAVYIMSDRKVTVKRLIKFSQYLGCHAVSLQEHTYENTSITHEHGPFGKDDFMRDLALVSNAEDAIIGDFMRTTSTLLLREIMENNNQNKGITRKIVTCPIARHA